MNMSNHTSFNMTNIENPDSGVPVSAIIHLLVQVLLFCVGSFIHLKLIFVFKEDKNKAWQIHITHSIVCIIYFSFNIPFAAITHFIPFLSQYTGPWLCYIASFIMLYCYYEVIANSLLISVLKYVFVVHDRKARDFGEEKINKAFFLINLIHPLLWTILTMITSDWESFIALINCFGQREQVLAQYNTSAGNIEKFFFCNLKKNDTQDSDVHTIYVIKQCICAFVSIGVLVIGSNLPEGFFYYKIFRKMRW